MRFLAVEKLSAHKYKTPEGYLVCTDAILSRTGKQRYARREIFGDDCNDPDRIIDVDRKPEDVFDEKAMASFENKPICVEHPDENVNISNFNELAVGFVRDIHKGKDNGQDVMMGTLVITNDRAIELVESGEYAELSCGYDIDIDDEPNPCQRNIRGNHVALCKQGRAGNARIVDSIDDEHVVNTIKGIVFKKDGLTAKSFSKFENGGDGTYELNDGYFVEYLIANRHNPKMHSSLKHYSDGDKTFAASELQDGRVVFEGFNTKFTPRLKAAAEAYFRINDSQGDSMDYSKKTKQGYDVVAIYRANGRLYAIAKRANDYLVAAGYDATSGTWAQGYYDFRNEDEAADWLREEHPGVRRVVDGKDAEPESKPAHDAWTDVYKQFEALITKYFPNSAKINAEVDKLYAQHKGDADWDLAYKKWRETATDDSRSTKDSVYTVKYEKDGVTYVRKVRASSMTDAIAKARK